MRVKYIVINLITWIPVQEVSERDRGPRRITQNAEWIFFASGQIYMSIVQLFCTFQN